jgi:predicted AlkP superfamily phosphohydrolase/phosphomutase
MEKGLSGKLRSVNPPISASAWTSFATGLNPGKTGIFDFVQRRPNDYKLKVVRSTDLQCRTIWEILSAQGISCGVMNVPVVSWPPQTVNGYVISGMPDTRVTTYPPELSERVRQQGWVTDLPLVGKSEEQIAAELLSSMEKRTKVAKQLLMEFNPAFTILVFTETDRIAHFLLTRRDDLVEAIYRRADELIGELKEAYAPTTTVLLSDHGCGPIEGTFMTNCWLHEKRFLSLEKTLDAPASFEDAAIDWDKTKAFSYGEQGKIHINLAGREPRGIVRNGEYENVLKELEEELTGLEIGGRRLRVKTWRASMLYSGFYLSRAPDLVFELEDGGYGAKTSLGHKAIIEPPKIWSADHAIDGIYAIEGAGVPARKVDATILDLAPTILTKYDISAREMDGQVLA